MKALYWIAGIVVVVGLLAFGGMRLVSDLTERSSSAEAFANTVSAAVSGWDPKTIEPFAEASYYESLQRDNAAAWQTYKVLGAVETVSPCNVSQIEVVNGRSNALVQCATKFEKGSATVQMSVSDYSGQWRVIGLGVRL